MAENFFTSLKDKFQDIKDSEYFDLPQDLGGEAEGFDQSNKTTPKAELSDADRSFVDKLPAEVQVDIDRYLDIFRNDPTPVYKHIAEIKEKGTSTLLETPDWVRENTNDKFDNMRYSDFLTYGKSAFDLAFQRDTEKAKELKKGILGNPVVETVTGVGHGLYTATRGTAELVASLSDLYLDTDYLKVVEDVLPQINLTDLLENPEPAFAQFVSLLTQYGTPVGIAQKIAKKIIGKATKTALGKKAAQSALATSTVGKGVSNVAKFGGYWALPVGLSDATVSASGQETIGGIFGKSEEEGGNWLQQSMLATEPESLEGLDGKERAAAILRNKLKFGIEGASFMGALKLVGPTAKFLGTGTSVILNNAVGPVLTGASKVISNKYVMKNMQQNAAFDQKMLEKFGVPDFNLWKFSSARDYSGSKSVMPSIRSAIEGALSKIMSGGKFGPQASSELKRIDQLNRSVKKEFDIFAKDLDREMYKLNKAGFTDILMGSETAASALKHWNDVLKYMRGEIKLTSLPSPLQDSAFIIRDLIDDQMKALQPILKNSDIKEDIIKNMGKYLHTSYEIFKNSKFTAAKPVYDKAVNYFSRLMSSMPDYKGMSKKQLEIQARLNVENLMTIGRGEGTTANARLKSIVQFAEGFVPKNTFKKFYSNERLLPDEISDLLGVTKDPKKIILDTIVENAHVMNTYKSYKEMADFGMGNLFFKSNLDYGKFIEKNNIINARGLVDIKIKPGYHIDMQGLFKNQDGTMMKTLPEISKAMSDTTLMMDTLLKLPMMKGLLAAKAAVQMNKTVLSLQTQMRNITTAAMFATANGHIGVGASVMDNFRMFTDDLLGKTKDPQALRKALKEAMDNGALDSSTVAQELEQIIPELLGSSKLGGKTIFSGKTSDEFFQAIFTKKGILGRAISKTIEGYQMGDNLWKFYGFQFSKSQLLPAFKNMDDVKSYFRLVEGYEFRPIKADGTKKTLKDAISEAAGLDVKNTYPNYSMIPTFVQNVRKFPFLGNFVAFQSEMYRNSFQILRRGQRMMRSENPYVRQIGARKLIGFGTTVGVVPLAAIDTAKTVTGITDEMYQAYKDSFASDYEKASDMMPVSKQNKDHSWTATDLGTLIPYAPLLSPFKAAMQTLAEGKNTDQNTLDIMVKTVTASIEDSLSTFLKPSIMAETLTELIPDQNGILRTKNGGRIADIKNDPDWVSKMMYHAYKKLGPTTLVSAERIMMAIGGDLTRSAQQYDLMDEVVKNLTGFGVRKQDPGSSMRFKMGKYAGEIATARNAWTGDIVDAGNLQEDIRSVANGDKPITIAREFEYLQSNNYRVMSEIYKDIKNLRILNFSEREIKDIIKARRAVSKQDLSALMLGLFNSEDYVSTLKNKKGALNSAIKNLNRTLGTFYNANDLVDRDELRAIRSKYDNIPLGLNDVEREEFLRTGTTQKLKDKLDLQKNYQTIQKEQYNEDLRKQKELLEKRKEFIKEQQELKSKSSQAPASMTLPALDNTMMASMTAGSAGNIDPTTNLTTTETALLSPLEQAYYTNKRRA